MTIDISHNGGRCSSYTGFDTFRPQNCRNSRYNQCFMNYYHSHHYLHPNPKYIYQVKPSVNHWQLRDLIHYIDGNIYYTKNDSIRALNLNNYQSYNHLSLNYFPRCFAVAPSGITVTGGLLTSTSNNISKNIESLSLDSFNGNSKVSKGLFSFYNPLLDISKTVRIGEVINNDVKIYESSASSYNAYICNNDSYLYCTNISNNDSITITNKINCEINTCLNNVVKNPQNDKLLTVTGDSKSIFMVDPTSNSPITNVIKSNHDSGFGIAYHPNGQIFSAVFQDGSCLLYDIRNLSRHLLEIKSTRHGHQLGAFRVCKFSPANDMNDLLIISEHVGRVHLIDLRLTNQENVNKHQVIVVPYALEQHADYVNDQVNCYNNDDNDTGNEKEGRIRKSKTKLSNSSKAINSNDSQPEQHITIDVFEDRIDNYPSFTAPLVYDYEYLTENPRIFKDFNYVPPSIPSTPVLPPPVFNYPVWEDSLTYNNDVAVSPTSSQRPSFSHEYPDYLNHSNPNNDSNLGQTRGLLNSQPSRGFEQIHRALYSRNSTHSYEYEKLQHPVSQIQGEMEIAGVEFCQSDNESKILIGGQDAAILEWNINGHARRCFANSEYA